MCTFVALVLQIVYTWCTTGTAQGQEFLVTPQSINVTLNETIIFTCQATGFSDFIWSINNIEVMSSFSVGDTTGLEVFCSLDRDRTLVDCGGEFNDTTTIYSGDPALLRVQGVPDPVSNLNAESAPSFIILTWVPPLSLIIDGFDLDFTYTVEVRTINTLCDGERGAVRLYENIPEPTFNFSLCELNRTSETESCSCSLLTMASVYEFTVATVNIVGRGEFSVVQGIFGAEVIDCGDLEAPARGFVNVTTTLFSDEASYDCDDGFKLRGDDVRVCQNDGRWSGDDPTCEVIDCRDLVAPANGVVNVTTTLFGGEASYGCDDGFQLRGDEVRVCQNNELWSGVDPSCEVHSAILGLSVSAGVILIVILVVVVVVYRLYRRKLKKHRKAQQDQNL